MDAGDNIVIVKINPEDVVSVPSDCNCEKLRTCKYEVVGLYQGELPKPLYKAEFEADSYVDDEEYSTVYDEYDEDDNAVYEQDEFEPIEDNTGGGLRGQQTNV